MTETKPQPLTPKAEKPAKKKKVRSYSVNDILNWKFEKSQMPEAWEKHLGNIDSRFIIYVDGEPGNGKTEYIMQMVKMLTNSIGKTRLNNVEQGKHTQIKASVLRNDLKNSVPVGKFQYDMVRDYEAFKAKIKRPNSGKVIIIDSISYWPLSLAQIQELIDTFKTKSFVFVAYKSAFTRNQPIMHNCDIKVRIEKFVAESSGRFGGNDKYYIWPEKYPPVQKLPAQAQQELFDDSKIEKGVDNRLDELMTASLENLIRSPHESKEAE